MAIAAKFNAQCKVCKREIKKGDLITDDSGHWCISATCGAASKPTVDKDYEAYAKAKQAEILGQQKALSTDLTADQTQTIKTQTKRLLAINKTVEAALKEAGDLAPNGAMIGQFTKIIFDSMAKA